MGSTCVDVLIALNPPFCRDILAWGKDMFFPLSKPEMFCYRPGSCSFCFLFSLLVKSKHFVGLLFFSN
jgi:hypothetical protein